MVSPEISIKELKKLSRRYAMTGGYEVALKPDLSERDLERLVEMHVPELAAYNKNSSRYRTNNSYRILSLINESPAAGEKLRERLASVLISYSQPALAAKSSRS